MYLCFFIMIINNQIIGKILSEIIYIAYCIKYKRQKPSIFHMLARKVNFPNF